MPVKERRNPPRSGTGREPASCSADIVLHTVTTNPRHVHERPQMAAVPQAVVRFDGSPLRIEDIVAITRREKTAELSPASRVPRTNTRRRRVPRRTPARGRRDLRRHHRLRRLLHRGDAAGSSWPSCRITCTRTTAAASAASSPPEETRAVLAARLASLARGFSGVRLRAARALRRCSCTTSCR